jgi:hypothetical protein
MLNTNEKSEKEGITNIRQRAGIRPCSNYRAGVHALHTASLNFGRIEHRIKGAPLPQYSTTDKPPKRSTHDAITLSLYHQYLICYIKH